jgi:DNA-binding SARP family transcriptional activator/predicted ATPase
MARLTISLLGPFEVTLDGERLTGFDSNKVRALLAYLAVEAERPHRRDALAGLLWPERPDRAARSNLRHTLFNLRKAIGDHQARPPFLRITRETMQFNTASDYWCDVTAFTSSVATEGWDQAALEQLEGVLALYGGSFLEGFCLKGCPAFDDWSLLVRERLQLQALAALHRLAGYYEQRGQYEQACAHARRQLELEPWQEGAHQQLMRLLALSGRRGAALAQYETCRRLLDEELGVEPGAETTQLYQAIKEGRELPSDERMATPAPSPAAVVKHNLPLQLTPFVGRETILAQIADRLQHPGCRLLTLVGPAGSGKTRLALEAATARLDDFDHGVYFVSLAPLESIEAIVPTVATALGLSFYAQTSGGPQSQPRLQLLDYLRHKTTLLIMDNFEHLLDGLNFVVEILQTASDVKILATSRATLNLQGEHLLPVPGMDLPQWEVPSDAAVTLADAAQYSAVELFLQSACRAQPGFALSDDNVADVIRICRLVEGMPLGIVLAAAWVGVLTPAEIASEIGQSLEFLVAELRDLPERQRSMRAAFDRSWSLLSERERKVFQRLSVFRGGFTRQAARQVAAASLRELRALVEKSLLQRDPQGRYSVHELLRQYAADRLAEVPAEWEAAKDRHSAYFAAFLQHREVSLRGRDQRRALAEIEAETDNVRVGWHWAVVQGRTEDIDRALESLVVLYNTHGWFQEKEEIFARAAQMLEEESSGYAQDALQSGAPAALVQGGAEAQKAVADRRRRLVLGKVLAHQGRACFRLGLTGKGIALLQRSLEILRGLGARRGMVFALCSLGRFTVRLPQVEGRPLCVEGLAISREIGDRVGMEMSLRCLGLDAVYRGEYGAAQRFYQERLAVSRELDQVRVAKSLGSLGYVAWCLGDYREAKQLHQQSLALHKDIGSQYGIALLLLYLGLDARGLVEYGEARQLFQDSLAMFQELGIRRYHTIVLICQGELANVLGQYGEAARLAQEALSASKKLDFPGLVVRSLQVLGDATYRLGDLRKAREYFLQALQTAVTVQTVPRTLLTLVATAGLLAAEGERERASELLALVLHHPASWQWAKDRAARLIAELETELSADVLAAAQERGQARDLQATVAELLVDLAD